MKATVILAITLYQVILSPLLKQVTGTRSSCRYRPTCSYYAKTKIEEYGIIRGGKMALKRLATCHPFAKPYGKSL
jgi:putative membrane protein insertion efficiency factor